MSAEQQISAAYLATGSDDLDRIDLEMLREAAVTLFNQYLSDKVRDAHDDSKCNVYCRVVLTCSTMEHAVLQSLDAVSGMTYDRPCMHHLAHLDSFKALKNILFCSAYGTWFGTFVTV